MKMYLYRISKIAVMGFLCMTMVLCSVGIGFAAGTDENGITYDQVADSNEMAAIKDVGTEGTSPIYGDDIEDGEYEISVDSSSSMFKIEKAVLTVKDGKMQVAMTMAAKGYLKLYMGTAKEAAEAELSEYIDFAEDSNGRHVFTVPIEALDSPTFCAAFSKDREKWYGRVLVFEAKNMPQEAVKVELPDYEALEKAARDARIAEMKAENAVAKANEAAAIDKKDGEYEIEVALTGGTGKASVVSPAVLRVRDGKAYALIEWNSSNYDYMKIGEEKYLPINTEENSTFELPISVFDEPISVIADTVAMSTPHEIEYTLTFSEASVSVGSSTAIIIAAAAVILLAAIFLVFRVKKKKAQ